MKQTIPISVSQESDTTQESDIIQELNAMRGKGVKVLLDAGGERRYSVRFVQLVSLIFCPVLLWFSLDSLIGASINPGEELAPLWERLGLALISAFFGIGFAVSMMLYVTRYVVRLEREGNRFNIVTLGVLRQRELSVPVADVVISNWKLNRVYRGRFTIYAPCRLLRLPGHRIPYVLDVQTPVFKDAALERLHRVAERNRRR